MDETTSDILPRVGTPPLAGVTLDSRYELFDDIGSGTIAHVFRAWDHQLQHVVAVKILDRRFGEDREVVEAFEEEARKVASLPTHRNIVSVYDVGRDGDLPYIVMELVAGGSLKGLIAGEAPLAVDRAFDICRQVATALEFAHQYGLVHRNVRPQNILVGATGQVKLTDFGLGSAAELSKGSRALPLLVRAQYLSPEQAIGQEEDARSDVYGLGIVLFEMLTGRLPFQAADPAALARKHAEEQPPDPARYNPAIPPSAARIVLQALDKDPEKRYRSAAALAAAVHEYLLLEKGETTPYLSLEDTTTHHPVTPQKEQVAKPAVQPGPAPHVVPVHRPRAAPVRTRNLTFMSVVFLVTVLIAGAGGWLAYRAVYRAINGSGVASGAIHHPVAKRRQTHAPLGGQRHAAVGARPRSAASGCAVGPVRFLHMWAESVGVQPGGTVTFDYTIANDTQQCRKVALALRVYSDTQPGQAFSDRRDAAVVQAAPGVHMYKRQFVFPTSTAGQRFDVALSVRDPSRTQVFGAIRVNHLIQVSSS